MVGICRSHSHREPNIANTSRVFPVFIHFVRSREIRYDQNSFSSAPWITIFKLPSERARNDCKTNPACDFSFLVPHNPKFVQIWIRRNSTSKGQSGGNIIAVCLCMVGAEWYNSSLSARERERPTIPTRLAAASLWPDDNIEQNRQQLLLLIWDNRQPARA